MKKKKRRIVVHSIFAVSVTLLLRPYLIFSCINLILELNVDRLLDLVLQDGFIGVKSSCFACYVVIIGHIIIKIFWCCSASCVSILYQLLCLCHWIPCRPRLANISISFSSLVLQNFYVWCLIFLVHLYVGYPRHAPGFGPLLWLSKEQGYCKSLWVTFHKGAQVHMVCATWVCHWPRNCFGSWCLDTLTSTCTSLSGTVSSSYQSSCLIYLFATFINHLFQNFCSNYYHIFLIFFIYWQLLVA